MRKIGLLGGTFNPIHMGHLALAQYALEELALEEVWLIPTGYSYRKAGLRMVDAKDRYRMTELAIADNPRMRCLDTEIRREGYTYSYETLEELHREYPDADFFYLFGADCLFEIEYWKYPERIFSGCTVVFCTRNGYSTQEMEDKQKELAARYDADIRILSFLNLEISSTDLRRRISQGKSVRYLVPDNTISYIEEHSFYREDELQP